MRGRITGKGTNYIRWEVMGPNIFLIIMFSTLTILGGLVAYLTYMDNYDLAALIAAAVMIFSLMSLVSSIKNEQIHIKYEVDFKKDRVEVHIYEYLGGRDKYKGSLPSSIPYSDIANLDCKGNKRFRLVAKEGAKHLGVPPLIVKGVFNNWEIVALFERHNVSCKMV